MSQFTAASIPQRPTMRRKSSAQNILASFISPSAPSPIGTTSTSRASASGAATPTTGIVKESDAQSIYADSNALPHPNGAASPQLGQGTSIEYLRDLVQKRIIKLTYIRSIYEGCVEH